MSVKDLCIIGGGPAGLSAALNGAAEGLSVALLERDDRLGGQAGTSSRIENYLGFGDGVAGACLTDQARAQAERLGAEVHVKSEVVAVHHNEATGFWVVECQGGHKWVCHSILIAVGVDYRRLQAPEIEHANVLYGASADSHDKCDGKNVLVVGGGNSAGQAALNLCDCGASVTVLVRRPLRQTMSQYLIERIVKDSRISVRLGEITGVEPGTPDIFVTDREDHIRADVTFAYIGSEPRTEFLGPECLKDEHGFIKTDADFQARTEGMFVAGDVRADSRKRVAVATGEGAIAAANAWRHVYGA